VPELPDLEVIREFLAPRLPGVAIATAEVRRPIIVRNLLGGDFAGHLVGRRFTEVRRRGKFLLLALEGNLTLAINPMLAGRIRYAPPLARARTRDALVLGLADGQELRYHDAADMGKVYLTAGLDQVPGFAGQGPGGKRPRGNARSLSRALEAPSRRDQGHVDQSSVPGRDRQRLLRRDPVGSPHLPVS
jgi:formamidopyrimidine-DNA glycosylase